MSKIIGGIFTLLGFLVLLFILFIYMNTSAFLSYNPEAEPTFFNETGLALPAAFALIVFIAGLIFVLKSKVDNPEMKD